MKSFIKKTTALLLSSLLIGASLLGCDGDTASDTDIDTAAAAQSSSGSSSGTSSSTTTTTTAAIEDCQESFQKSIGTTSVASTYALAESEDSYYCLAMNYSSKYMYVIDKETHTCLPLCNKSDCLHEDETDPTVCNAYFSNFTASIAYYDGCIYYNTVEKKQDADGNNYNLYEICKMDSDGMNREVVFSTEDLYITFFKMHRGYFYIGAMAIDDEGGSDYTSLAVYKLPIGGSEVTELLPFYEYIDEYSLTVADIRFCGDSMLIEVTVLVDGNAKMELVNYDLTTNEYVNISEKLDVNINSWFTVFNDKIVFSNGTTLYECDLNGDNQQAVLDFSQGEYAETFADCQYFNPYTNDGESIIITAANDEDGVMNKVIFCDSDYNAKIYEMPYAFAVQVGCDSDVLINYNEENLTLELYDKSTLSEDAVAEPTVLYEFK